MPLAAHSSSADHGDVQAEMPIVRLLKIEYDGETHRFSLAADNRRQNRILEAGYRLLRFTASDIFRTPASVVGQVERALRYSIGSPN